MTRTRVLLAGESWISQTTHVKGFDKFSTAEYQTGIDGLRAALEDGDIDLVHMPGHEVPTRFPATLEAMDAYDVIVISDIGANSILLHPDTFVRGRRTPDRLKLLAEWVKKGGAFMMIGGYYSFQGLGGEARYRGTPAEAILPVSIHPWDDRVEVPDGFLPRRLTEHPAIAGIDGDWPWLLGYNEVVPKPDAEVVLAAGGGDHPLLVVGTHGNGRTAAWTSDIGPHWLPQEFIDWPGYARLWKQTFAWLAGR